MGFNSGFKGLIIASENNIHLAACPSHTSHLLQKVDDCVWKPLKLAFRDRLYKIMPEKPNSLVAKGTSNLHVIYYSSSTQLSIS